MRRSSRIATVKAEELTPTQDAPSMPQPCPVDENVDVDVWDRRLAMWQDYVQTAHDLCASRGLPVAEYCPSCYSKNRAEMRIGLAIRDRKVRLSTWHQRFDDDDAIDDIILDAGFVLWLPAARRASLPRQQTPERPRPEAAALPTIDPVSLFATFSLFYAMQRYVSDSPSTVSPPDTPSQVYSPVDSSQEDDEVMRILGSDEPSPCRLTSDSALLAWGTTPTADLFRAFSNEPVVKTESRKRGFSEMSAST